MIPVIAPEVLYTFTPDARVKARAFVARVPDVKYKFVLTVVAKPKVTPKPPVDWMVKFFKAVAEVVVGNTFSSCCNSSRRIIIK